MLSYTIINTVGYQLILALETKQQWSSNSQIFHQGIASAQIQSEIFFLLQSVWGLVV